MPLFRADTIDDLEIEPLGSGILITFVGDYTDEEPASARLDREEIERLRDLCDEALS